VRVCCFAMHKLVYRTVINVTLCNVQQPNACVNLYYVWLCLNMLVIAASFCSIIQRRPAWLPVHFIDLCRVMSTMVVKHIIVVVIKYNVTQ